MSGLAEGVADVSSATSAETWDIASFVAAIGRATPDTPFSDEALAFCAELSTELMRPRPLVPGQAQLVSLGYWLRPASITRMRESFERTATPGVLLVPRGRVFHVTPANVDTMFAYSWLVALLVGNVNVVRLSSRETDLSRRILDIVATTLDRPQFARLRAANHLVRTGHDDRVAATLSSIADVRVVWGGDDTVDYFRRFPLPHRGRDVTFPNRHSLALLDAAAIRSSSDDELAALADRFFNDAYWFDQAACSSPRLIIWRTRPRRRRPGRQASVPRGRPGRGSSTIPGDRDRARNHEAGLRLPSSVGAGGPACRDAVERSDVDRAAGSGGATTGLTVEVACSSSS